MSTSAADASGGGDASSGGGRAKGKARREKRDALLSGLVARLEGELRSRQQQLVAETARNTRAKAHLELVKAFSCAADTLNHMRAIDEAGGDLDSPEAQAALAALDRQLDVLKHAFDRGGGAGTGNLLAGGGEGSGSGSCDTWVGSDAHDGEQPATVSGLSAACSRAGAQLAGGGSGGRQSLTGWFKMRAGPLLRGIMAYRTKERSKQEFIEFWQEHVMEIAMLLHQCRGNPSQCPRFQDAILEMGSRFGALFFFDDWALDIIMMDMESGRTGEAPQSLWDRVAACMDLSPDQALMFDFKNKWWRTTTQALQQERQELAARALEAPADMAVQEAVASGLERVNATYLVSVAAALVVGVVALLRPEQVAESWVCTWPRLPLMTAILDAMRRQQELR